MLSHVQRHDSTIVRRSRTLAPATARPARVEWIGADVETAAVASATRPCVVRSGQRQPQDRLPLCGRVACVGGGGDRPCLNLSTRGCRLSASGIAMDHAMQPRRNLCSHRAALICQDDARLSKLGVVMSSTVPLSSTDHSPRRPEAVHDGLGASSGSADRNASSSGAPKTGIALTPCEEGVLARAWACQAARSTQLGP